MWRGQLDRWDCALSISSGVLTAAMDIFWVGDISLADAHEWGVETTEAFVKKIASRYGFKGGTLSDAIKILEAKSVVPGDQLTNDFGGGTQHHLRDFSHHPTPVGIIFSIITQFSGCGYGTDTDGNFIVRKLPDSERIGDSWMNKIYNGVVLWCLHIVSDIAGSSSSAEKGKEGTGLPGPLLSFFKEISAIPLLKKIAGEDEKEHYKFSKTCSKMFNGTLLGEHDENGKIIKGGELKFDLRTEIGIVNEAVKSKQYIPVLLNELMICGFYAFRRFFYEIEKKEVSSLEELGSVDVKNFLPFNSKTLKHMISIGATSFTLVNMSVSGLKAAIKNKGDKKGFALDFIQSINYFGIGRVVFSLTGELAIAIQNLYSKFSDILQPQSLGYVKATCQIVVGEATPCVWVSTALQVYQEIYGSIKELKETCEERIRVDHLCEERIEILKLYRSEMEEAVSDYMKNYLEIILGATELMDKAINENDSDAFILGSNKIQNMLGKETQFGTQTEFDVLMENEVVFKL